MHQLQLEIGEHIGGIDLLLEELQIQRIDFENLISELTTALFNPESLQGTHPLISALEAVEDFTTDGRLRQAIMSLVGMITLEMATHLTDPSISGTISNIMFKEITSSKLVVTYEKER